MFIQMFKEYFHNIQYEASLRKYFLIEKIW